uniref:Uncharacterized protein n=1 Tax=Anguilla anguilla TaxID=7936 RepID=A0A0E9RSJ9_ANGAN
MALENEYMGHEHQKKAYKRKLLHHCTHCHIFLVVFILLFWVCVCA